MDTPLSKAEILIVEDSPTQLQQLRYILEKAGYRVSAARNGVEALAEARRKKPRIVVSDILMPEMDGYQLCREIKQDKDLGQIPVVLLTALFDPQDVLKGLEGGADNFITKPYIPSYLLARLEHILVTLELRKHTVMQAGVEVVFGGRKYFITSERQQILDLLLSTYDAAIQKNGELIAVRNELAALNEKLEQKVAERTAVLEAQIEARKQAEEAIERLRHQNELILNSAGEGILGLDLEGKHTFVNPAAARMFGYEVGELIGRISHSIWHHTKGDGTPYPRKECRVYRALLDGAVHHVEDEVFWRKDGSSFPVEYTSTPITEGGRIIGAVVTFKDITDRRRAEEQVKASLEEKVLLLKEIHHRVKNNMQIISSLLRLQSRHVRNEEVGKVFQTSQTRIRTMALIHERLYHSGNFAHIDMGEYIRELAVTLFRSYEADPRAIALDLQLEKVFLGIDTAIPCGLILNELISNSLKHAFPRGRKGKLSIGLHSQEEEIRIFVADDGQGFPPHLDFRKTPSLGLQLAVTLIDQIDGKIELKRDGVGTEFCIRFREGKERGYLRRG